MNNLWNRSVGPFDEAAAQRHRHMGLLDCNGDVNADAVNFLAHLCAGLFFDALCDSYVEMQTVSRICQAFCKSENVEAQRVVLMICSEYDVTTASALTTGTYNARLTYRILYKTNYNDYRVLASNLLSTNNYSFGLSGLQLMAGEVVTDIYFDFGTVPSGFQSVTKPTLMVSVNPRTANKYYVTNRADAGGKFGETWQSANASWITIVRNLTPVRKPLLPKTGY